MDKRYSPEGTVDAIAFDLSTRIRNGNFRSAYEELTRFDKPLMVAIMTHMAVVDVDALLGLNAFALSRFAESRNAKRNR